MWSIETRHETRTKYPIYPILIQIRIFLIKRLHHQSVYWILNSCKQWEILWKFYEPILWKKIVTDGPFGRTRTRENFNAIS